MSEHWPGPEQQLPPARIRVKIGLLLAVFHALRYPERHADEAIETDGSLSFYTVPPGQPVSLALRPFKDPSITHQERAALIAREFRPIARWLLRQPGNLTAEALPPIAQTYLDRHREPDLQDESGYAMRADELLPPVPILAAMMEFNQGRQPRADQRCLELEQFITEVYRPDPEFPRRLPPAGI